LSRKQNYSLQSYLTVIRKLWDKTTYPTDSGEQVYDLLDGET